MMISSSFLKKGMGHKLISLLILCLFPVALFAQNTNPVRELIPEKYNPKSFNLPISIPGVYNFPLNLPKRSTAKVPRTIVSENLIYLEHCENLSFDKIIAPDYQVLTGDVQFSHQGAWLYCDSAHFYRSTNSLFAFGNVHMEQGDTIFLYSGWMFYEGNFKLAKVRDKVRLENKTVTLFTDSLNFDRITNISYFFDGGLLVDTVNELSSEYGQYSSDTKLAEFRNNVKLVNPDFVLTTEQLNYNTRTTVADIIKPTEIVADSGYIYSTSGWYNTSTKESMLLNRSFAKSNKKRLTADTLFYNSANRIGRGYGRVVIEDSIQNVTLKGDFGYSDEKKDSALLTKNALFIEHSSKDTLFLHADTLISYKQHVYKNIKADKLNTKRDSVSNIVNADSLITKKDTLSNIIHPDSLNIQKDTLSNIIPTDSLIIQKDSLNNVFNKDSLITKKDSLFSAVKAYTGVRFYRNDMQGICDTLSYSERDSILNLVGQPVLWSEKQQLTGEFMQLHTKKQKPEMLHIQRSAMAVAFEADSLYNQFSGKELKAFFDDSSEVVRIEVSGNAETVFLPRDDGNELMGFNRMEGSSMTVFRKDGKLQKLVLWPQPKGKFYPLEKLDPEAKYLKNFEWLEDLRPKNQKDVLSETPKTRVKKKEGKGKSSTLDDKR